MLDELASGVPTTGAPDIERAFGLSHASTALVIFVVPGAIALVVDPIILLLADRYPPRWFVIGGLAAMGAGALIAAAAPGPAVFAVAMAVWFLASGAACAVALTTLIDADPERQARTMARWTLCGNAGDLLAPLMLGVLAALGFGWRAAFAVVGVVLVGWAIAVASRPFTAVREEDDDERLPLWQAFRAALRDRVLVLWLAGMVLCDLLDEILVVFASLHARHELGASIEWQAAIIGASMIGGAIGLVALERMLAGRDERTLLIGTGVACVVSYAAWLAAPSPWLSALLMVPVGATSAPLYPLVAARAYARCPGRANLVLAVGQLFAPIALALPWLLGRVADHAGTHVALGLLAIQPLGLATLARITSPCPPAR